MYVFAYNKCNIKQINQEYKGNQKQSDNNATSALYHTD